MPWTGSRTRLTEGNDTGNTQTYVTASVTLTAGRLYVISFCHSDTASENAATSVQTTGGAVAFASKASVVFDTIAANVHRLEVWSARPTASVTATITIDLGDAGTGCCWVVEEITGHDPTSDPIVQAPTNNADASTTVAVTPAALKSSSSLQLAFGAHDLGTTTDVASGTNWSSTGTGQAYATPSTSLESAENTSGTASQVTFSTAGAADRAVIALEIRASENAPLVKPAMRAMMALAIAAWPAIGTPTPNQLSRGPLAEWHPQTWSSLASTGPKWWAGTPGVWYGEGPRLLQRNQVITEVLPAPFPGNDPPWNARHPLTPTPDLWYGAQRAAPNAAWNVTVAAPTYVPKPLSHRAVYEAWRETWYPAQRAAPNAAWNVAAPVVNAPPPTSGYPEAVSLAWRVPAPLPTVLGSVVALLTPGADTPPPFRRQHYVTAGGIWYQGWTLEVHDRANVSGAVAPPAQVDDPIPYRRQSYSIYEQWQVTWRAQSAAPNAAWNVVPPTVNNPAPYRRQSYSTYEQWQVTWQAQRAAPNAAWNVVAPAVNDPPPLKRQGHIVAVWSIDVITIITLTDATSAGAGSPTADEPTRRKQALHDVISAWQVTWRAQRQAPNAAWNVAPPSNPTPRARPLHDIIAAWQTSWGAQKAAPNAAWNVPASTVNDPAPRVRSLYDVVAAWQVSWSAQKSAPNAAWNFPVNDPAPRARALYDIVAAWQVTWAAQAAAPTAAWNVPVVGADAPPPRRPYPIGAVLSWQPPVPLPPRAPNVIPYAPDVPLPRVPYPLRSVLAWQVTWGAQKAAPVAPLTLVYGQNPPIGAHVRPATRVAIQQQWPTIWWPAQHGAVITVFTQFIPPFNPGTFTVVAVLNVLPDVLVTDVQPDVAVVNVNPDVTVKDVRPDVNIDEVT